MAELNLDKFEAMQCCLTVRGKVLEQAPGHPGMDLEKVMEKWRALPDAERASVAITKTDGSDADSQDTGLTPPAGGLILKGYTRVLMNDSEGTLRYVNGKDLRDGNLGEFTLDADYQQGRTAAHEAQPHYLWLTEAEWHSLIPADPKKGDVAAMPSGIATRILRWHLNPLRFYGRYGRDALEREDVRAGQLALTVESVSASLIRLRLDGFARLGKVPPPAVAEGKIASLDEWGYEPRVLGFLEYAPQKRIVTRFDIVALGEHFGRLGIGRRAPSRVGLQPLGMAFHLVKGDNPADRVPPGRPSDSQRYFNLSQ